jgi:hypothetical protein
MLLTLKGGLRLLFSVGWVSYFTCVFISTFFKLGGFISLSLIKAFVLAFLIFLTPKKDVAK